MKIETELISSPQWIELPEDIMANIFERLNFVEILESVEKVCTTWRRICSDLVIWRELVINIDIDICDHENWNKKLWRRAVDRSQGQMTCLSIVNFCDNNLLNYAVNRSSGLKALVLLEVEGFTGKELVEAVKKLPHLEVLNVFFNPKLNAQDVINIGISCPNLKSFIYNPYEIFLSSRRFFPRGSSVNNEYALAVVENMPNLCCLGLISNPMDNRGLEAILDGCPNLESLNLYNCNGLDLRGALGKRCSEQIKQILIFPSNNNNVSSSEINQSSSDINPSIEEVEEEDDYVPWVQSFDINI